MEFETQDTALEIEEQACLWEWERLTYSEYTQPPVASADARLSFAYLQNSQQLTSRVCETSMILNTPLTTALFY